MNNENLTKEIKTIIAEIMDLDESSFGNDVRFVEDLGLDSLKALAVLAALEKKYKIEISEDLLPQLTNVTQTVEVARNIIESSQHSA